MSTMKTYKTGNLSITVSQAASGYIEDLCADIEVADRIKGAVMHSPDSTPQEAMTVIAKERESINDRVIYLLSRFSHEDLQVYKKRIDAQRARHAASTGSRRQKWADELVICLKKQGFERFPDVWRHLTESEGYQHYVENNKLHYEGRKHANPRALSKDTFRTEYWGKRKKK